MKSTKKALCLALALLLTLSCVMLAGCGTKSEVKGIGTAKTTQPQQNVVATTAPAAATDDSAETLQADGYKKPYTGTSKTVEIDVKDYGKIIVRLDSKTAPLTVQNFLNLVNEGFYDGLTFHRIIKGFMVQGGDPQGTGMGGSTNQIKGEFASNGVINNIKHVRGVISMARSSAPNSASSQFFITHQDAPHLDGEYAAFGKVTSGMEVVDKLADTAKVEDANGTVAKANQPVINSIKILE